MSYFNENERAKKLIHHASEAMMRSYSPYSGYKVGAALLTKKGNIYTGCNIENASFTPTVCAERCAIFKAVSEGESDFVAIAIVGGKDGEIEGFFPPCGVCRQVMTEFCSFENFAIYLGGKNDEYKKYTLSELLPMSFNKDNINS